MRSDLRVVVEPSALVSAAIFARSTPRAALNLVLEHGTLLLSLDMINELRDVLSRGDFDRYLSVEDRADFVEMLVAAAEVVTVDDEIHACRDRKDDYVLALGVSGRAS